MIKFYAHKILQTSEGEQSLDVSFNLEKGQFLSLYGNSGAGKIKTILEIRNSKENSHQAASHSPTERLTEN